MTKQITAIECRFAIYCPPPKGYPDDYHLVKEVIHYDDKTTSINLRAIKNYQRPFYITQQSWRNHKDKKEAEDISKVNKYKCRQFELVWRIQDALGGYGHAGGLRDVCSSPYVYGADISSTALLKRGYMKKWPVDPTPYTLATLDIETDMKTEAILMCTVANHQQIYTVIHRQFLEGQVNVEAQLYELAKKHAEPIEAVKREWIIEIVDEEIDVATRPIKKLHEWKPDVVAIWNIIFDIRKIENCIKRYGMNPADIFSDPSVPKPYRNYRFHEGPDYKFTENGTRKTLENSERWHWVTTPASFVLIDAMCLYRAIRNQETKDRSYSLDYILAKELKGRGKMKFDGLAAADEGTGDWHTEMQQDFPLEYIIYNRYDSTGMLDLDAQTQDIARSLAFFSGVSDFSYFPSQPRRIVDDLDDFYMVRRNQVVAATGKVRDKETKEFLDKLENLVIGRDGWIATLDPELFVNTNSTIFVDAEGVYHSVHLGNADSDVTGAYPNGQCAMNISKKTTHKELVSIDGKSKQVRMLQGLNLSGGYINAMEIATELYNYPPLDEWARAYSEDHA